MACSISGTCRRESDRPKSDLSLRHGVAYRHRCRDYLQNRVCTSAMKLTSSLKTSSVLHASTRPSNICIVWPKRFHCTLHAVSGSKKDVNINIIGADHDNTTLQEAGYLKCLLSNRIEASTRNVYHMNKMLSSRALSTF